MKRKHTKQPAAQVPAPQPRREVARLSPDPEQGLTLHQVKERQQNGWANDPVDSPTKTGGQIVRENVFTFFNFIFVVLAALLVAVGSFDDMLFLLIAVANTGIGIVQQLRSKQTVDKLNLLAAPRANVVREGNLISVPAAQLVRDDVAELASGDQIPADATVLSGQVQVNEALITGESLAQVASQTVKALQCTDAAQDLPILRPLIGMDKTEIIETSRHIGTYETSILPYEDCCTIFTPPHPKIRPELAEILEAEAAMPGLAELEAEAAENTERIRIRITDEIEFEG